MREIRHVAPVALLLLLAACGGEIGSPPSARGRLPGAATGAEGGSGGGNEELPPMYRFLTVIEGGSSARTCFPEALVADAQGLVRCTVFVILSGAASCSSLPGLTDADPSAASAVRQRGGIAASSRICVLAQLPSATWVDGSCESSTQPGWCYVAGPAAGPQCPQAFEFSPGSPPPGAELMAGCY